MGPSVLQQRDSNTYNAQNAQTSKKQYREPFAIGKALPGYRAVLLDTEDSLAKLCKCPAVRCAQASRMRPGHFYLPQISYVKMAEVKPSISALTEHLKKPYPPESHN